MWLCSGVQTGKRDIVWRENKQVHPLVKSKAVIRGLFLPDANAPHTGLTTAMVLQDTSVRKVALLRMVSLALPSNNVPHILLTVSAEPWIASAALVTLMTMTNSLKLTGQGGQGKAWGYAQINKLLYLNLDTILESLMAVSACSSNGLLPVGIP